MLHYFTTYRIIYPYLDKLLGGIGIYEKILILLMSLFVVASLAACGDEVTEEKDINSVNTDEENAKEENDEEAELETKEVAEVVADDNYIKATLVSVEHKVDELFDEEKYTINFDLENKTSDKLTVQARDVSIDGTMVDDMVFFSEDIAGDKKANGKMDIENYEGALPEMKEDIEFTLIIVDDETYETLAEHDVKVDF